MSMIFNRYLGHDQAILVILSFDNEYFYRIHTNQNSQLEIDVSFE